MTGRILKSSGGSFHTETALGVVVCRARGSLRLGDISPCAGDFVRLSQNGGDYVIDEIFPRENFLARPSASNIDLLIAVVSVCEPRPNIAVLDTMTVLARLGGISTAIAFTKCDLEEPEPWLTIYKQAGFKVYCLAQKPDDDLSVLQKELSGKTVIFAGNSGAGKSSLLNRILPGLGQETAEISRKLGRGKHTTRRTEFFRAGDMLLGDSPGFSALELGTQGVTRRELANGFGEFAQYTPLCRFHDCAHIKEPGCAVRNAAENSNIPIERYRNYTRFYEQLK